MRLLGVDFGTRRVGLAVVDTDAPVALPFRTAKVANLDEAVRAVVAAVKEEGIATVVVGLPRRLTSGSEPGTSEKLVAAFVNRLRAELPIPVETEDERFTTAQVERLRRDLGAAKRQMDRDASAAALILESYLERKKRRDVETKM